MSVLIYLIPVSLVLLGIAVWAFFWAVRRDQFDDLDTPAIEILAEDHNEAEPRSTGALRAQREAASAAASTPDASTRAAAVSSPDASNRAAAASTPDAANAAAAGTRPDSDAAEPHTGADPGAHPPQQPTPRADAD